MITCFIQVSYCLLFKYKSILLLLVEKQKNLLNSTAEQTVKNFLGPSATTANSEDEVLHYLILAIVVTVVSVGTSLS